MTDERTGEPGCAETQLEADEDDGRHGEQL